MIAGGGEVGALVPPAVRRRCGRGLREGLLEAAKPLAAERVDPAGWLRRRLEESGDMDDGSVA
ncbi:MAG: hypothetical protein U0841_23790 [Chloroflexia bacterium]